MKKFFVLFLIGIILFTGCTGKKEDSVNESNSKTSFTEENTKEVISNDENEETKVEDESFKEDDNKEVSDHTLNTEIPDGEYLIFLEDIDTTNKTGLYSSRLDTQSFEFDGFIYNVNEDGTMGELYKNEKLILEIESDCEYFENGSLGKNKSSYSAVYDLLKAKTGVGLTFNVNGGKIVSMTTAS